MKIISLLILMICSSVFAQEAIVTKTKGQEATIIIPKGSKLDIGDTVYLTKEKEILFKKDSSIDEKMKQVDLKTKREHDLWFDVFFNSRKNEYGKEKFVNLRVGYGYNFGYIEPFLNYGVSAYNNGSYSYNRGVIGGGFEVNLIKNEPGINLIPFLSLGAEYATGEDKYETPAGTKKYDVTAGGTAVGFGLKWFILKENFAIRVGYYISNHNFNAEYEGEIVETGNENNTTFRSGFSFYF